MRKLSSNGILLRSNDAKFGDLFIVLKRVLGHNNYDLLNGTIQFEDEISFKMKEEVSEIDDKTLDGIISLHVAAVGKNSKKLPEPVYNEKSLKYEMGGLGLTSIDVIGGTGPSFAFIQNNKILIISKQEFMGAVRKYIVSLGNPSIPRSGDSITNKPDTMRVYTQTFPWCMVCFKNTELDEECDINPSGKHEEYPANGRDLIDDIRAEMGNDIGSAAQDGPSKLLMVSGVLLQKDLINEAMKRKREKLVRGLGVIFELIEEGFSREDVERAKKITSMVKAVKRYPTKLFVVDDRLNNFINKMGSETNKLSNKLLSYFGLNDSVNIIAIKRGDDIINAISVSDLSKIIIISGGEIDYRQLEEAPKMKTTITTEKMEEHIREKEFNRFMDQYNEEFGTNPDQRVNIDIGYAKHIIKKSKAVGKQLVGGITVYSIVVAIFEGDESVSNRHNFEINSKSIKIMSGEGFLKINPSKLITKPRGSEKFVHNMSAADMAFGTDLLWQHGLSSRGAPSDRLNIEGGDSRSNRVATRVVKIFFDGNSYSCSARDFLTLGLETNPLAYVDANRVPRSVTSNKKDKESDDGVFSKFVNLFDNQSLKNTLEKRIIKTQDEEYVIINNISNVLINNINLFINNCLQFAGSNKPFVSSAVPLSLLEKTDSIVENLRGLVSIIVDEIGESLDSRSLESRILVDGNWIREHDTNLFAERKEMYSKIKNMVDDGVREDSIVDYILRMGWSKSRETAIKFISDSDREIDLGEFDIRDRVEVDFERDLIVDLGHKLFELKDDIIIDLDEMRHDSLSEYASHSLRSSLEKSLGEKSIKPKTSLEVGYSEINEIISGFNSYIESLSSNEAFRNSIEWLINNEHKIKSDNNVVVTVYYQDDSGSMKPADIVFKISNPSERAAYNELMSFPKKLSSIRRLMEEKINKIRRKSGVGMAGRLKKWLTDSGEVAYEINLSEMNKWVDRCLVKLGRVDTAGFDRKLISNIIKLITKQDAKKSVNEFYHDIIDSLNPTKDGLLNDMKSVIDSINSTVVSGPRRKVLKVVDGRKINIGSIMQIMVDIKKACNAIVQEISVDDEQNENIKSLLDSISEINNPPSGVVKSSKREISSDISQIVNGFDSFRGTFEGKPMDEGCHKFIKQIGKFIDVIGSISRKIINGEISVEDLDVILREIRNKDTIRLLNNHPRELNLSNLKKIYGILVKQYRVVKRLYSDCVSLLPSNIPNPYQEMHYNMELYKNVFMYGSTRTVKDSNPDFIDVMEPLKNPKTLNEENVGRIVTRAKLIRKRIFGVNTRTSSLIQSGGKLGCGFDSSKKKRFVFNIFGSIVRGVCENLIKSLGDEHKKDYKIFSESEKDIIITPERFFNMVASNKNVPEIIRKKFNIRDGGPLFDKYKIIKDKISRISTDDIPVTEINTLRSCIQDLVYKIDNEDPGDDVRFDERVVGVFDVTDLVDIGDNSDFYNYILKFDNGVDSGFGRIPVSHETYNKFLGANKLFSYLMFLYENISVGDSSVDDIIKMVHGAREKVSISGFDFPSETEIRNLIPC